MICYKYNSDKLWYDKLWYVCMCACCSVFVFQFLNGLCEEHNEKKIKNVYLGF